MAFIGDLVESVEVECELQRRTHPLPAADRDESQRVCFIARITYGVEKGKQRKLGFL
jgi:hypothetical protein